MGAIEISTKDDGSVSVASIDLVKSGKRDGAVDMAFVVIRPSERITRPNTIGTIRFSASTTQNDFTSLDCQLGQQDRLFIAVGRVAPPAGNLRIVAANRIVRFTSGNRQTHQQVADYMFQRTNWDTTPSGR